VQGLKKRREKEEVIDLERFPNNHTGKPPIQPASQSPRQLPNQNKQAVQNASEQDLVLAFPGA